MPLKPILDSLDGVPENVQSAYRPYEGADGSLEGKYVLDVEPTDGWALENVAALKRALGEVKEQKQRLGEKLKRFRAPDGNELDPDHVVEALSRLEKLESGDLSNEEKVKERLESATRQLEQKFQTQLKKLEQERDGSMSRLKNTLIRNAAMQAISKHEGYVRALLPHVTQAIEVRFDDNGREELMVLDEHGQPRISPTTGQSGYMTVDELVKELKADPEFRGSFKGTDASGGGLDGSGQPSKPNAIDPNLNPIERLRLARANQGA